MRVFEYKLVASKQQAERIDEAVKITQFIRNKALRLWMDTNALTFVRVAAFLTGTRMRLRTSFGLDWQQSPSLFRKCTRGQRETWNLRVPQRLWRMYLYSLLTQDSKCAR